MLSSLRIFSILVISAAALVVFPASSFANFGSSVNGIAATGTFRGEGVEDVVMETEVLNINLRQAGADVEVRYTLHNTGGKKTVRGAFPVRSGDGDVQKYEITADDQPVTWKRVNEKKKKKNEEEEDFPKPGEYIASWLVSEIAFAAGQTRSVRIRYYSPFYQYSGGVSDDSDYTPLKFGYLLSTGAAWKGPIGKGKVTVTVDRPEASLVKLPARFKEVAANRYEWDFAKLEPTLEDDINIDVEPGYQHRPRAFGGGFGGGEDQPEVLRGSYVLYKDRNFWEHTNYTATASSTLKGTLGRDYEAKHLSDRDPDATWSEGVEGDGIGEKLTLDVKQSLPLYAIRITPGFMKSEALYFANNRVASLKVTLNGEHTFDVSMPDEFLLGGYPILVKDYKKPVSKIELEITGVHRGTKHRDTCVSAITLVSPLSKKPKIASVR
jgi:hypothetical protein